MRREVTVQTSWTDEVNTLALTRKRKSSLDVCAIEVGSLNLAHPGIRPIDMARFLMHCHANGLSQAGDNQSGNEKEGHRI